MIILVHAIGILTPGATAPINLKLINWCFFIASIRELGVINFTTTYLQPNMLYHYHPKN